MHQQLFLSHLILAYTEAVRLAPDLAGLLEGLDIFLGHVYFGRNFIPELWYIAYAAGQF